METTNEYQPPSNCGDNNWSMWINGSRITKIIRWHIIDHVQRKAIRTHIANTTQITPDAVNMIDWDMIEKASKEITLARRIWILKHVSGFAPTASKMVHRSEWDDVLCPQCRLCRETTNHIMECRENNAIEHRVRDI